MCRCICARPFLLLNTTSVRLSMSHACVLFLLDNNSANLLTLGKYNANSGRGGVRKLSDNKEVTTHTHDLNIVVATRWGPWRQTVACTLEEGVCCGHRACRGGGTRMWLREALHHSAAPTEPGPTPGAPERGCLSQLSCVGLEWLGLLTLPSEPGSHREGAGLAPRTLCGQLTRP